MTAFLALIAGAGLALLSQMVIQLLVVPRAEVRKRREARWEENLLSLGELLTAELPDRAATAQHDQWVFLALPQLIAKVDRPNPDRVEQLEQSYRERAHTSTKLYEALAKTRCDWLANRVLSIESNTSAMAELKALLMAYQYTVFTCTNYRVREPFDLAEFRKDWAAERNVANMLKEIIEKLIDDGPPRSQSKTLRRLRGSLHRVFDAI